MKTPGELLRIINEKIANYNSNFQVLYKSFHILSLPKLVNLLSNDSFLFRNILYRKAIQEEIVKKGELENKKLDLIMKTKV